MLDATRFHILPPHVGIGYKAQHYINIIKNPGSLSWLEIHAKNYVAQGGRPIAQLRHLV